MSTRIAAAFLLFPVVALTDGYQSPDEAAIAALSEALPLSDEYEYAGVLYEQGSRFYFTEPESSGDVHDVEVRVQYPRGATLGSIEIPYPCLIRGKDVERESDCLSRPDRRRL